MRIEATNLNFHSTFKPQIVYISKILKLAQEKFKGDEREISSITGIPTGESTGKVIPHLHYAKYMGLIDFKRDEGKFILNLTKLGKVIWEEDPYLIEDLTRLVLHYNITDIQTGAPHWSYLFKVFNSNLDEEYTWKNIEKSIRDYFGIANLKLGMLKGSYQENCFELIRVIDFVGSDKILFNTSFSRIDFLNAYGYTLIKSIEQYYEGINEITVNQITDEIKWNKPFGFDYETTLAVLDELEISGYIKVNKQLNPATILKLATTDEMISNIYKFSM